MWSKVSLIKVCRKYLQLSKRQKLYYDLWIWVSVIMQYRTPTLESKKFQVYFESSVTVVLEQANWDFIAQLRESSSELFWLWVVHYLSMHPFEKFSHFPLLSRITCPTFLGIENFLFFLLKYHTLFQRETIGEYLLWNHWSSFNQN